MAEYDSFLQESAGTILGPVAALMGGDLFLPRAESLLPRLFKKLVRRQLLSLASCVLSPTFIPLLKLLLSFVECQLHHSREVFCHWDISRG